MFFLAVTAPLLAQECFSWCKAHAPRLFFPGLFPPTGRQFFLPAVSILGVSIATLLLTRWLVAAGFAGAATAALFSRRVVPRDLVAKTDAIASWTRSLRDMMGTATGLTEAVIATAPVAPEVLRGPAARLARRAERSPLVPALECFAADVAHPSCDFVVAVLCIAATQETKLRDLLGMLASCTAAQAQMLRRIEVSRARIRTSVRMVMAPHWEWLPV